ncbi:MAG TPA: PBP1A family penicillin-binding protein [Stellaceae bacterium]|nr:PBP1A family penicillin-binding protein [Stellaceae bacterium]
MAGTRGGDLRANPQEGPARRSAARDGAPRKGRPRGRLWRRALLCFLWAAILGGGGLSYFALTLPPLDHLAVAERRPSVTLLAADGSLIATFGDLFGQPLRLNQMSRYIPEAVIATEDRRFYSHFGIDPWGILRAAVADLRAGHVVEGGSTITQQLAKNLFLTNERTLGRKIRETLLALWLEHKFTKNQILEIYLNRVYLGAGTYGVDAAAHRYFGTSARNVTLYQAAVIGGLLKAPTRFSPARDSEAAAERARQVLDNMVAAGFINEAQARAAAATGRDLARSRQPPPGSRFFADWVAEQLGRLNEVHGRDVVVTTTLDPRIQADAEGAVLHTLDRDGTASRVSEGALVAMSPDGAVRAMVGGRDYADSQFNRATQALRQPGSSFKPFVYLAALQRGMTPGDRFNDHRIRIGKWEPRNYENRYVGEVTAAEALADSINTVAAQVIERAGVDNVIAVAHRLGITTPLTRDDSLALGTSDVTLIDLTSAYAAFASGGIGAWPYGITEVRDTHGTVLYRRSGAGPGRVIDPGLAGEMNRMLMGVIAHGTGRNARLDRPAAGKTGTTQDYRDALFVGYTADLVTGVWFGNDDDAPMRRVTGGTLPARTWKAFMVKATAGMPVRPLPMDEAPPARVASAAPEAAHSGGLLQGLLHAIFGGGATPTAAERASPYTRPGTAP